MAEDLEVASSLNASDELETVEETNKCVKLDLPAHIAAFLKRQDLNRDFQQIICDQSLLENVAANYVIVKKILSFLQWQDKLLCKNVCSMWRSAVHTLQKEQMAPSDFAINLRLVHLKNGVKLMQSDCFYTEPLVVLAFANMGGFCVSAKCEILLPCPCDPACDKEHYLLDVVKNLVVAPKSCMLGVKACYTSYMPLRDSVTYKHCVSMKFGRASAFIGGLYIPMIPNVEFHVINIKSLDDIPGTFIKTVDKLAETRYVKGALVFVNESFILHSVEDIVFLNYLKDVQPDVPYALGGCLVEDTVSDNEDMNFMIEAVNASKVPMSENIVSIGLFTVPKNLNSQADACNFDVFSLILESHDWSKAKVETAINEFARKVPHFTHSVVIKMSCVGRDSKHEFEQNFFRTAFPNTRLVGCYGNGELGINRPERPPPEPRSSNVKRQRAESPQYGLMYSYSTVFVYIGWGNIVTPGETA